MVIAERVARQGIFAFGPYQLIPDRRMLLRADMPVLVPKHAWEILLHMVERAGQLVTWSELMLCAGPEGVVAEGVLRASIADLRELLEDGKRGCRYLEKVTDVGYRFTAPVTRVDEGRALTFAVIRASASPHSLPESPVIGREAELCTLIERLPQRRLTTIVGAVGVGKSTLAAAAISGMPAGRFEKVCFVDVGSISDSESLHTSLACHLGLAVGCVEQRADIAGRTQSGRVLMVLDNCEPLVDCVAHSAEKLLALLPGLHLLATSREPLRAKGECVLRLAPLALPPRTNPLTFAEALSFPAVALFISRVMASRSVLQLHESDVAVIVEICRKLDGLPLAIELAALRTDVLSLRYLSGRLDHPLQLLTWGRRTASLRGRTLRAMLDSSYRTLCPLEGKVLRRLAVFKESFNTEAAIALAVDPEVAAAEVLDTLMSLAAKSWLAGSENGGEVCFRLLRTTRAYVLELLEGSVECDQIKQRYEHLGRSAQQ